MSEGEPPASDDDPSVSDGDPPPSDGDPPVDEDDPPVDEDDPPAVRLEGITKRFGDVVANDGVDFTLERGTVHAIVGENGAGKTTLMSILYGLYRPDDGRIVVDGEPKAFASPRDANDAGIGMIHQHFQLVDTMTVLQNVVLGHEPTERGLVDADRARDDIREVCATYGFDVDDYLDSRIEELGIGVPQRAEIVNFIVDPGWISSLCTGFQKRLCEFAGLLMDS